MEVEYTKKATSNELLEFVRDFNSSLEVYSNVYLGIGAFPFHPYNPNAWKNCYQLLQVPEEIEIITHAKNNTKAKVFFVDYQYRRIFNDRGWIYVCNALNKVMNELGELRYDRDHATIRYDQLEIVYYPINLPTDYDCTTIQEAVYLECGNRQLSWVGNLSRFQAQSTQYGDIYKSLLLAVVGYLAEEGNRLYVFNRAISYGHFYIMVPDKPRPLHITQINNYYEEFAELVQIFHKCVELNVHRGLTISWQGGRLINDCSTLF